MIIGKQNKNALKILSTILSVSLVISGLPFFYASANDNEIRKPTAEELLGENYMKPSDFDRNAVNSYADELVAATTSITDIGRLPTYEEFVQQTGYENAEITLTEFQSKYLTGTNFIVPDNDITILITIPEELDKLSSLVNNTVTGETSIEQSYYSTASYMLSCDLTYASSRYLPIGTDTYPFNGTFDGDGYEISGIKISGDSIDSYSGVGHFGVFGYIGRDGIVKSLGVVNANTNLPYTVGVDVGVIAGRNYGTLEDVYVNSSVIKVSNATVGAITAENYGTITRTYASYNPKVSYTSGSYSEPQPILQGI